ncbi:MAG: hypothetical protein ABF820_08105 [Sporolactobacillus sp.]
MLLVGYIFVSLDFNIGRINILPDSIGYLLIFIAARALANSYQNKWFKLAKSASLILLPLSILKLWISHSLILNGSMTSTQLSSRLFSFVSTSLMILLLTHCLHSVCRGIEKEAQQEGRSPLVSQAKKTWRAVWPYQLLLCLAAVWKLLSNQTQINMPIGNWFALSLFFIFIYYLIYSTYHVILLLRQAQKSITTSHSI